MINFIVDSGRTELGYRVPGTLICVYWHYLSIRLFGVNDEGLFLAKESKAQHAFVIIVHPIPSWTTEETSRAK